MKSHAINTLKNATGFGDGGALILSEVEGRARGEARSHAARPSTSLRMSRY
tara:strand:+ start:137 stop:289 length:153 start_codon:yes stop_codon:yes gene_type:complete